MRPLLLSSSAALFASCAFTSEKGIIVYNETPFVTIIEPLEGAIYDQGEAVKMLGEASDDQDLEFLTVEWTSSIDGLLDYPYELDADGYTTFDVSSLSVGTHTITLRATDGGLAQGEATVEIEVVDVPELPSIDVLHPISGERGVDGYPFVFAVEVEDPDDPTTDLVVEMAANPGGVVCTMVPDGQGNASCSAMLPLGNYLLTFVVEDPDGNTADDQATFDVIDPDDYDFDGDGFTVNGGDCDDDNHTVYPGAPEICDGLDNDCNSATGIDVGTECYDDDGDTFCEQPPCVNSVQTLIDCDDTTTSVSPWGIEVLNGIDDNCDGRIDEGTSVYDDDADGYCETPPCVNAAGTVPDCDDTNYSINPGILENCNTLYDDNCNVDTNEKDAQGCTNFYYDGDGDGFGVPGQSECWCEDGNYPYTGLDMNDCYDSNANANPLQTSYFVGSRGDGSFDYDCSGGEEKQYYGVGSCLASNIIECDLNPEGWQSTEPDCGVGGNWLYDCDFDEFGFILGCASCALGFVSPSLFTFCQNCLLDYCDPVYTSKQQGCR